MLSLKEISDEASFLGLKPEWDRLLSQSSGNNIFLTFDWLHTWFKILASSCKLCIIEVRSNNELVGIAPLMIAARGKIFKHRVLTFIGVGTSDYADFIIKDRREEVLRLIIAHITNGTSRWDSIDLSEIPGSSPHLQLLTGIAWEHGLAVHQSATHNCSFVPLDGDWPNYFNSLSGKLRSEYRRSVKRLEALGQVRFDRKIRENGELNHELDEAFRIFDKRWQAKGEVGSLSYPIKKLFVNEVAKKLNKARQLDLVTLRLNEKMVAYQINFNYSGKIYGWNTAFDPDYKQANPGVIILKHMFEDSFGKKLKEIDLLRGDSGLKHRWAPLSRTNYRISMTRNSQ